MAKRRDTSSTAESATSTCVHSSSVTLEPKTPLDSRAPSPSPPHVDLDYPDGGLKAWLTVFGAVLALFCCGQLTAFGAFETWYAQNQLRDLPVSAIAWIGSLQLWLLYFSVRNILWPRRIHY